MMEEGREGRAHFNSDYSYYKKVDKRLRSIQYSSSIANIVDIYISSFELYDCFLKIVKYKNNKKSYLR